MKKIINGVPIIFHFPYVYLSLIFPKSNFLVINIDKESKFSKFIINMKFKNIIY